MPLLGATGNSSEYSYRGNYDNISTVIDFNSYENFPLLPILKTSIQSIDEINYKIPLEIVSGSARILIVESLEVPTFDSTIIKSDNNNLTFDSNVVNFSTFDSSNIKSDNTNLTFDSTDNISNYVGLTTTQLIVRNNVKFLLVLTPDLNSPRDQYNTIVKVGGKEISWNVSIDRIQSATNLKFNNLEVSSSTAFAGISVTSTPYIVEGLSIGTNYVAEILSEDGFLNVNSGSNLKLSPVSNGDNLSLTVVPSTESGAIKNIDLGIYSPGSVGIAQTNWSVRTLSYIPENFVFNNIFSAELLTDIATESRLITGIDDPNSKLVVGYDTFGNLVTLNALVSFNNSDFNPAPVPGIEILNNTLLRIQTTTSNVWDEQITIPIFIGNVRSFQSSLGGSYILSGFFTEWTVKNRSITINIDSISSNLLFALPLETKYGLIDISPEIRQTNGSLLGFRSTITNVNSPSLSNQQSKFYFSSGQFNSGYLNIQSNPSNLLRSSNFTFSAFIYVSNFNFNGSLGPYVIYSPYKDTLNSNDFGFSVRIKGDSWSVNPNLRRGIAVSIPVLNSSNENIILETKQQVLSPNTWHHIALVRNNNVFTLYVDGINVGLDSINRNFFYIISDFTGYNYRLGYSPQSISENYYIQDARLYKGNVLYTNNFDPNLNVTSILEKRID